MNNASAAELFISSATDALFIFCAITAAIFLTRLTHCNTLKAAVIAALSRACCSLNSYFPMA